MSKKKKKKKTKEIRVFDGLDEYITTGYRAENEILHKQLEVATGALRRIYYDVFDVDQSPIEFAGKALDEIRHLGEDK
jgi:hypothetical protein